MKKLALLGLIFVAGCKTEISSSGVRYCGDMISEYQVVQEDGNRKTEVESRTKHVDSAYINIYSNQNFAFSYQLDNQWHTDADMKYILSGDNMIGTSVTHEKDSSDKSLTVEKVIALTVNTYTGDTKWSFTTNHLDKNKSVLSTETHAISGQCDFNTQSV